MRFRYCSLFEFQVSPTPRKSWPHSRKKLVIRPRETHSWRWIIRGENFEGTSPTPKVLLRVTQGWRCGAKRATLGLSRLPLLR